jgi:hypothetical protein
VQTFAKWMTAEASNVSGRETIARSDDDRLEPAEYAHLADGTRGLLV